jgi:choline dehydrogenase-like flavoprotein
LSPTRRDTLRAAIERLVPDDGLAGAAATGVVATVVERAAVRPGAWRDVVEPGLRHLAEEALARYGRPFAQLEAADADAVLAALEADDTTGDWTIRPAIFLATLATMAMDAFYGRRDSPAWKTIGYDEAPKRSPGADPVEPPLAASRLADAAESYDVVVVGAGSGGGAAARVLAEAGADVLVVDRGPALRASEVGADHVANHRLAFYGVNTPPAAGAEDPRVVVDLAGEEHVMGVADESYSAMPHCVGGGGRVYQGIAWRFHPLDFRLATEYGVPDGSSLADWPLTYDDLEPYYDRAEWELGVAGDATAHANQGPRSRPYPMPPPPWTPEAEVLRRGADRLGLSIGPPPILINTVPRNGRARCVQCGACGGFACPSDAKNASHNVLLPAALATGRCTLLTETRAVRIETGRGGAVTGVELLDVAGGARRSIRARHVVVACGAIETARLLLASKSDSHPGGLGNANDQVGRSLQGHLFVGAFGLFDEEVVDCRGPGVRVSTCDFLHRLGNGELGGILGNQQTRLPIQHWRYALPPEAPRWGSAGKAAMRDLYRRTSHLKGPIQEIPNADARVTLDEDAVDRHGVPVVRLSGQLHPDNLQQARTMQRHALEWLSASGATEVWTGHEGRWAELVDGLDPLTIGLSASHHQAGTCRMGDDERTSVTDRWGRVHGHEGLWITDASLHVSNGGCHPVLTVYALAYRNAERLAQTG